MNPKWANNEQKKNQTWNKHEPNMSEKWNKNESKNEPKMNQTWIKKWIKNMSNEPDPPHSGNQDSQTRKLGLGLPGGFLVSRVPGLPGPWSPGSRVFARLQTTSSRLKVKPSRKKNTKKKKQKKNKKKTKKTQTFVVEFCVFFFFFYL